jgi:hypothetical protein
MREARLAGREVLPVAGLMQMEELGYGEDHEPQSDHGRTYREYDGACLLVMRVSRAPTPDAEDLSKKPNQ